MRVQRRMQLERLRLTREIPEPEQAPFRPPLLSHGQLVAADVERGAVLIRNIARAMLWYEEIKGSKTTIQIARENNTSKHRVQQSIDRAFIAPDIVKAILEGTQPMGFTSDWLMRNPLPSDWQDQRKRIANL